MLVLLGRTSHPIRFETIRTHTLSALDRLTGTTHKLCRWKLLLIFSDGVDDRDCYLLACLLEREMYVKNYHFSNAAATVVVVLLQ